MARLPRAVVTTSWDDGDPLDLRVADLLCEFGLSGTFYVAPRNRERPPIALKDVGTLAECFEIGGHGLEHRDLTRLDPAGLRSDIEGGKSLLEDLTGATITSLSYPLGRHDARVTEAVRAAGFRCARTTWVLRTERPEDPFLMHTSASARRQGPAFWLAHSIRTRSLSALRRTLRTSAGAGWLGMAAALFQEVLLHGGVWHLWGHSREVVAQGLWAELREIALRVSGHDEVTYMTNGELAAALVDEDTARP